MIKSEHRSCVKVAVDVLGTPSLTVPVICGRGATFEDVIKAVLACQSQRERLSAVSVSTCEDLSVDTWCFCVCQRGAIQIFNTTA